MKSEIINTTTLQTTNATLEETSSKISLGQVFAERGGYINELNLFLAHFNTIPNIIIESNLDCKRANDWFLKNYKPEIKKHYFSKRSLKANKPSELDDIFYFLYDDLIIDFDTNDSIIRFLFSKTEISEVEKVINRLNKFKTHSKRKPHINLIERNFSEFTTKPMEIKKPKLNINDNYNDDFRDIHEIIYKRLSKKNDKGLILLHGKPGTGKTSYIRYLVSLVKKKQVIFLPPNLALSLTDPDFISLLIDNPNSILVIEEAENIIIDREKSGYSPVSALLNITDGLLADCLNIQVICSFNTDISKVDSALMRKGRLIAKYEFKELEVEKANALSNKLGYKNLITSPMSLTAIYNQEEKEFNQTKKYNPIGFKTLQTNEN